MQVRWVSSLILTTFNEQHVHECYRLGWRGKASATSHKVSSSTFLFTSIGLPRNTPNCEARPSTSETSMNLTHRKKEKCRSPQGLSDGRF